MTQICQITNMLLSFCSLICVIMCYLNRKDELKSFYIHTFKCIVASDKLC